MLKTFYISFRFLVYLKESKSFSYTIPDFLLLPWKMAPRSRETFFCHFCCYRASFYGDALALFGDGFFIRRDFRVSDKKFCRIAWGRCCKSKWKTIFCCHKIYKIHENKSLLNRKLEKCSARLGKWEISWARNSRFWWLWVFLCWIILMLNKLSIETSFLEKSTQLKPQFINNMSQWNKISLLHSKWQDPNY